MKRLVALLLIGLLPAPAEAQAPPAPKPVRIRITGADTYEVPGVMRLDGDRIFGKAATADSRFVQFRRSDGSRLLTIPRPGRRLTGKALAIADGLLEFVPEGNTERFYLPLDAVVKIEGSRVHRPLGPSVAGGVYAGAGIFVTTWLAVAVCDEGCENAEALFNLIVGAAIAVGGLVTHKMHGQRWEVVSSDELGALLNRSPNPI